jgi:hypothetical protein
VFQTLGLVDTVILCANSHQLSRIRPNGSGLLVFEFADLTETQASEILNSPEASLCREFHRVWRQVRWQMDAVQFQGGRR